MDHISVRSMSLLLVAAALYSFPFLYAWRQSTRAPLTAISESTESAINVLSYGAKGDGVTDDGDAFARAFEDAAKAGASVVIPKKVFVVNRELQIQSGLVIRSDGATITHTDDGKNILAADGADDWVLQGPLTLIGTRNAEQQIAPENGLRIRSANRYIVDKLTLKRFKGAGIEILAGDSSGAALGDQGQFAFLSFVENRIGLLIHDGSGAEYNLFTLTSFSGNEIGMQIAAGNNVISTANVVNNNDGIQLSAGVNSGHGIFSGVNISHNSRANVSATDVDLGYTFNGCHIYGDSDASGVVQLTNSQGLHFVGGDLDSAVIADGDGINFAFNNFNPGANLIVTGTNPTAFAQMTGFDAYTLYASRLPKAPETNPICTWDNRRH